MALQMLVIFVIRTCRLLWRSQASPWLKATSLSVLTLLLVAHPCMVVLRASRSVKGIP